MIEITELTRRFGAAGIRDVSFSCQPGTVTGFLGPNGAGKSTTLRVLCGLDRPDRGAATIDGQLYASLPQPGRRVGVMLDPEAMHRGRTGRETLGLAAAVLGVDRARAAQILDVVGLDAAAARKRVGQYSLGMRQRLALGMALLGDPGVLILDEPANGLDPQGVHWIRVLLREFADRGGTVLLSSHLLHEVEAVADHLVIISDGRVVADGAPDQLRISRTTMVRAIDLPALSAALSASGRQARTTADGALETDAEPEAVGRIAAQSGAVLTELRPRGNDLEQLFLSLTGPAAAGTGTPAPQAAALSNQASQKEAA
jgi:ABC-2 type transport system ATP-binding protein